MVVVYLATAIGIPVYMHYCGGELEEISYLVKSNGCCGDEEEEDMSGCCENENVVARYAPDFTFKKCVDSGLLIADLNLFPGFIAVFDVKVEPVSLLISKYYFPPPELQHSDLIRTTFLRI